MYLVFLLSIISVSDGKMEPFMLGGQKASIENWPFIAFVEVSLYPFTAVGFGGSLISSQTVLTAAHCLDDYTKKKTIKALSFRIFMGHSTYAKAKMARVVLDYDTHENYSPYNEDVLYDIGIMFLTRPVTFLANVQKAILQRTFNFKRDKDLLVAGWGYTDENAEENSKILNTIELTAKKYKMCKNWYRIICTISKQEEYPFLGDSGGPVVKAGTYHQVGILSFRNEDTGIAAFTSVPEYWDWIEEKQLMLFNKFCGKRK